DAGEGDDHDDDDEAHHRVVEHREREERLPALLDVLLVLRVLGAARLQGGARLRDHGCGLPRIVGETSPARGGAAGASSTASPPAASFDHGGEETPSRTTRYRCSPISAKIRPGATSMCSE